MKLIIHMYHKYISTYIHITHNPTETSISPSSAKIKSQTPVAYCLKMVVKKVSPAFDIIVKYLDRYDAKQSRHPEAADDVLNIKKTDHDFLYFK